MGWATALRESQLMFPIIEGLHLLGLAFIMGPVLMLDFRLAGFAWKDTPVSKIAKTFVPYSLVGATVMFVTGILLFCAEAVRCYNSGWFRIKIVLLVVAEIYAPVLTTWLAPGFPPDRQALVTRLTRIMLPAQAFFFVGGVMTAVQYAQNRFLIPSLAPLIYNGGIIVSGSNRSIARPPRNWPRRLAFNWKNTRG